MNAKRIRISPQYQIGSSDPKKFKVPIDDIHWEQEFIRDCPNYQYIPTVLPKTKRIIVIGDVHGDLNLAVKSFKLAGLINDDWEWIAEPKHTVVVQVGDQIDSCRPIMGVYDCKKPHEEDKGDDMGVMDFFNLMHNKAAYHAGAVYSLLGNHELMNVQKNFSYVSHKNLYEFNYDELEGVSGRTEAFTPGGPVAKMMACTRQSVLIIGSNLFVHAGILPSLIDNIKHSGDQVTKLKYLNSLIRKWLLNKVHDPLDKQNINYLFEDTNNLFWTRVHGEIKPNASIKEEACMNSVGKTLELFKLDQMIVGHSPQFMYKKKDGRAGINGTCYDDSDHHRLYRIDNGLSLAFRVFENNASIQVLEIIDDNIFNILTDEDITEPPKPVDIGIDPEQGDMIRVFAQSRTKK